MTVGELIERLKELPQDTEIRAGTMTRPIEPGEIAVRLREVLKWDSTIRDFAHAGYEEFVAIGKSFYDID